MIVNDVELVIEAKTGIGYSEGEAIQVYPANLEWPVGGMDAQSIVDSVSPESSWSFSAKDIDAETRITTVLIFVNE